MDTLVRATPVRAIHESPLQELPQQPRRQLLRRLLYSLAILLLTAATAHSQVSFRAITDAKRVSLSGYFEVQFILENGRGSNFDPPDFAGFRIITGPSQSMSTSIINGVQSSETVYAYVLQPTRLGKATLGRATIEVRGKRYRTNELSVEVVDNKSNSDSGTIGTEEDVFLRAELDQGEVYIGQQVPLNYRIYTLKNINSYNILEESNYRGFYVEDLRRFSVNTLKEEINGQSYTTKTLKRVALFPQQTGTLTIDPMRMQVGIAKSGVRDPRDFFFTPEVYRLSLNSAPLDLEVKPLPPNAPPSFTGAVGQYSFYLNINQSRLTTDDALEIKVRINGNGDPKRVQAPNLELGDAFEVYDPQTQEGAPREMETGIYTAKEYTYLAIPKRPGTYELQPEFTFFNPETATYETTQSKAYTITVSPGSEMPNVNIPNTQNDQVAEGLLGIRRQTELQTRSTPFFGTTAFWGLTALPVLLFLGVLVFKKIKARQGNIDPEILKQRRAEQVARQHLAQAKAHLEANKGRAFYDEVSKAMMGYINDKLNIPNSKLTKSVVQERLQVLNVPTDQIDSFMRILNACEMALFAGKDSTAEMQDIYERAVAALTKIEIR